jgi:2-(1,2-epoxy-1,2-dihydrophenyl)acetyl-CoA isomerase
MDADPFETLEFELTGAVATITLARPDKLNALDLQMAEELFEVAMRCDHDPAVRAVVLTGAGRAFMAGGDLAAFDEAGSDRGRFVARTATLLHAAISHFNRMDAPVVAAVNGVAAGAGMSFALSTDLALAARSARFTMAYTRAGLTPDGSSTYFLPRLVGLRRAQELVLTNRELSAEEALDWGLVNQVLDDDELMSAATDLATKLAAGPTRSLGAAKRMMREGLERSLETQMEVECREIAAAASRPDGREGTGAFLAKRRPEFTGE